MEMGNESTMDRRSSLLGVFVALEINAQLRSPTLISRIFRSSLLDFASALNCCANLLGLVGTVFFRSG